MRAPPPGHWVTSPEKAGLGKAGWMLHTGLLSWLPGKETGLRFGVPLRKEKRTGKNWTHHKNH